MAATSPALPMRALRPLRALQGAMRLLALAAALCALAGVAAAHPHVFVEARTEVVFDDAGRISAVRHVWRFDEGFSAFASQGLDANRDGVFSQEELAPLAQVNVESLKEYHYFTFVDVAGKQVALADPKEYWLSHDDGRLTLFFTLPLAEPIVPDGRTVRVDVYDPEYYVAIDLVPDNPFALAGDVPPTCKLTVKLPEDLDPQTATMLAVIPPDTRNLPENLRSVTQALANSALIDCPAAAAAPPSAGDAGTAAPRFGAVGPFGVGAPEATGGPPTGVFAVIAEWQRAFYEMLTDAVKRLKDDRWAALTLIALGFGYGVFHAAGPGHGKAVIAAYLVANEATAKKAIALSFLSALLQAVVAIAIVGVAAAILNLTSFAITSTARVAEIASAGLVVLLGTVLVVRKVLQPAATAIVARLQRPRTALSGVGFGPGRGVGQPATSRFACDEVDPSHVHGPSCGHVVEPAKVARGGLAAMAVAVVSAGARPCTGALIALVFALSQGMFAAGVVATLAMAVGTGLTVAALGLLAVGAKGLATRLSASGSGHGAMAIGVLEGAASLGVLALGLTLLMAAFSTPV